MDDIVEYLKNYIHKRIEYWTSKFYYYVNFIEHKNNRYEFVVDFSLPTQLNPIPAAKVKVYFTCTELPNGEFDTTFRFENQSLVHKFDSTIRGTQMEKWIERFLKEKEITRNVLFLGTEFEAERIKNDKIDQIFKEAVLNPVTIELKKLNDSLLSSSIDYTKSETSLDERTLELLKNTMYDFFRSVDKEDVGVVSYDECREVLKAMEVELSDVELNNLLIIADKNANGMIEYKEFVPIGAEVLYGLVLKQHTEREITIEDDMFVNQAIMVLYNDEIHDLCKILVKDCKEIDDDQYGKIQTDQLVEIFKQHPGVFNEREYELIFKQVKHEYPETFPYNELPTILFKYKVDIIKHGLMEGNVTKLEQYIRKLFEIFDTQKTGKLTPQVMMEALSKAEKVILSQMQLYILRNFVVKDADGNVDYNKESKFLAEMIKKFFSPSVVKKQAQFVEKGAIHPDAYMEGWTQEALTDQMNEIFQLYDADKDRLLDKKEYKKMINQAGINLSDEELYAMMQEADKNKDGFIDFNEFRDHFYDVLKLIRRSKAMYAISGLTA